MTRLRSLLLLAIALQTATAASAKVPPFCSDLLRPPPTCDVPALPCDEQCIKAQDNNPEGWYRYWEGCGLTRELTLAQKRVMCGAPRANELHVEFYTPALQWVCCTKYPFGNKVQDEPQD